MVTPVRLNSLAAIAARVNARERKNRADSIRHAREQGLDLKEARDQCVHGMWEKWVEENLDIGLTQAKAYIRFVEKSSVTDDLETQWESLQRAEGNRKTESKPSKSRPALIIESDRAKPVRIELTDEPLDLEKDKTITVDPNLVIGAGEYARKDVDVYRPDGSLLLAFRWRVVDEETCRIAHPALRSAARWSEHRQADSGVVGFYDDPEPRQTAFNRERPDKFAQVLPYLHAMDRVFRRENPGAYVFQLSAVAKADCRWVIDDTVFTTATVNRTEPFPTHCDNSNLAGSLAILGAFRAGEYSGGLLVFPRWRVAVDLSTRDVLIADTVSEPHGVTAFVGEEGGYERISVVAYFRAGLA